jgi:hypothetical protein
MELSKDVVKSCVETVLANPSLKALIIPEESFGEGFWAECKKLERSFYLGVPWQEAARFFEKKIFEALGGYDEKITGVEDFDLPSRLEYKYGEISIGRINEFIYHNEQKLSLTKACKKRFYYAANLDTYLKKDANKTSFYKRTSLIRRYRIFLSRPIKLVRNPILGIGVLFMKTCEFGSAAAGYLVAKIKN